MADIIANIFLVITLGWAFRKYGLVPESAEKAFNRYLYYAALPALTFVKIIDTPLKDLGTDFLLVNTLPIAALMALIVFLWLTRVLDWRFARLLVITAALGNTVYLGFPVVSMRLGEWAIGYAAVASSVQNILIFTLGFLLINVICEGSCPVKAGLKRLVLRNFVLWASIAGLAMSWFAAPLPGLLRTALADIGKTALPLALFTIGVSLYGKSVGGNAGKLSFIAAMKLFVLPLFYLLLASLLDFEGGAARAGYLEACMPVAVMNYVLAKEFDFDADLVSQSIVFTTLIFFPLLYLYDWAMTLVL
ncbi:MAG: AEC family transporter [Elusimicrobia bacterium]|nr:AEC family transporter [Elusimicrobiota bacterium]